MTWTEEAWAAVTPIFAQIREHPFLKALSEGALERKQFLRYIEQDALYLDEFGRVLAGLAARLSKAEHKKAFLEFAGDTMAVEGALHQSFLGPAGLSSEAAPSPTCLLYTSYLQRQLAVAPLETAVAAVLPCFQIYKEVGEHILALPQVPANPYQSWIDTYGGAEFAEAVRRALAIADELAEAASPQARRAMKDAFIICSKMEWMFWDAAWRLEAWGI